MAWSFDETNDYVSVSSNSALDLSSGDWTIAGWVKLTDNSGSSYQTVVSRGNPTSTEGFNISIAEAGIGTGQANDLVITVSDGSTAFDRDTSTNPFNGNTSWTHLGFVKSSSSIFIYVNGSLHASKSFNIGTINNADPMEFGRDGVGSNLLGGQMAEFGKWNRALSTSEISALAEGFAPSFFPRSLSWYTPMIREYRDIKSGLTVTNNGTTTANHPRMIYPSGMTIGKTIAVMTQDIVLTGLASVSALGSPGIFLNINPTGLPSTEAMGSPGLVIDDTITLLGLASASAIGTAVVSRDGSIDLTGLASTTALGTPVVNNTQVVTVSSLVNSNGIGSPTLALVQTISLAGLPTTTSIGPHSVNNVQIIQLEGIPSTTTFGVTVVVDLGFSLVTPTTGDFSLIPF